MRIEEASKVLSSKRFIHPALTRPFLHSLFLTYLLFVTLIARTPASSPQAELMPLWSWYEAVVNGRTGLLEEIGLNVVLFVPIGAGMRILWETKPWKALLIGLVFSAIIETTQYFTCRGLFEWDDMIHKWTWMSDWLRDWERYIEVLSSHHQRKSFHIKL